MARMVISAASNHVEDHPYDRLMDILGLPKESNTLSTEQSKIVTELGMLDKKHLESLIKRFSKERYQHLNSNARIHKFRVLFAGNRSVKSPNRSLSVRPKSPNRYLSRRNLSRKN